MILLQKKSAKAKELNIPSCISCYLGVTEPAMFGVNLKYVFPFICGMTGSCIAAILCVATGVTASAIGVGGLPGILSIQPAYIAMFAVCMVIAVAVPFALTYAFCDSNGDGIGDLNGIRCSLVIRNTFFPLVSYGNHSGKIQGVFDSRGF